MTPEDVLNVYDLLRDNNINVWVDGGWCVDVLLGKQTRDHPDLDIAVQRKDNAKLRRLLEDQGYVETQRKDTEEWMYVMENTEGKQVDVHVFEYDGKNIIYGVEYPHGSLTGEGMLNGRRVNCIDPEWMFKFKTSYPPKEKDIQDVNALSAHFGFKLPDAYVMKQ